jgi:hypothetical protein
MQGLSYRLAESTRLRHLLSVATVSFVGREPILPDTEESQLPANGVKAASNSAEGS